MRCLTSCFSNCMNHKDNNCLNPETSSCCFQQMLISLKLFPHINDFCLILLIFESFNFENIYSYSIFYRKLCTSHLKSYLVSNLAQILRKYIRFTNITIFFNISNDVVFAWNSCTRLYDKQFSDLIVTCFRFSYRNSNTAGIIMNDIFLSKNKQYFFYQIAIAICRLTFT